MTSSSVGGVPWSLGGNMQHLDTLIYYMRERESIRKEKEIGLPPPWTDDPILAKYHFCNNHREDDRGTKERRAVVVGAGIRPIDLPCAYTASNLFNYAPTLEVIFSNPEWVPLVKELPKKFHTAYVITTCGEAMDKVDYCARLMKAVVHLNVPNDSCAAAYSALRTVPGLGSFLAGQIVADLKNDRYLENALDWWTFSVMGPGSKKGLDHLFGGGTTHANYDIRMEILEDELPEDCCTLHRQDLQNVLCEWSKFMRYKLGLKGRRRPYAQSTNK
jgi:hypothetical protein